MPFNKLFLLPALVLAFGGGAAIAASTDGPSEGTTSSAVVDVKGPCDEAEHANDPRCAGAQVPEDEPGEVEERDDAADEDVKGPCDEVEHANDPRCTSAQVREDDGEVGEVEDRNEDEAEENAGHSASSGPSREAAEDNSGSSDES